MKQKRRLIILLIVVCVIMGAVAFDYVRSLMFHIEVVSISPNPVPADGETPVTIVLKLTNHEGEPVEGHRLYLLDSYWVLIIPVVVQQSIYGVFLLTTAFRGLPKEIFEAAKIDGAGNFGCYWRIAVPLSLPIMCTLGIMEIVNVWNDYIWPQITIRDIDKLPISAGLLVNFEGAYSSNMPVTFAGYLLSSLPLILLFVFANKYYVQGLVGSGIKM